MKKSVQKLLPLSKNFGFTLLEILLVLVIISIMASMLAVSISDNSAAQLNREADRLVAVLEMASEEALLQGLEISLAQTDIAGASGYQFLLLNIIDNQWQLMPEKPFVFYSLPAEITMTVELDEKLLVIDNQSVADQIQLLQELGQDLKPLIMLFSSGEISPFIITLQHQDVPEALSIRSDGLSGIERL